MIPEISSFDDVSIPLFFTSCLFLSSLPIKCWICSHWIWRIQRASPFSQTGLHVAKWSCSCTNEDIAAETPPHTHMQRIHQTKRTTKPRTSAILCGSPFVPPGLSSSIQHRYDPSWPEVPLHFTYFLIAIAADWPESWSLRILSQWVSLKVWSIQHENHHLAFE